MTATLPPMEFMNPPDLRLEALRRWISVELARPMASIDVASADASFRRYFRVTEEGGATLIAMDAPPDKEDIRPYLSVARLLAQTGVHVPHVHEVNLAEGFVLLEDLGSTPYLGELRKPGRAAPLYGAALEALADIQVNGLELAAQLPPYDAAVLEREMGLLTEWFTSRHLGLDLAAEERGLLRASFDLLIAEALAQPKVFVHRDYHSRNLMVLPERNPGVIDFQDALHGPLAYDLVSLLKDCYIAWPREQVERWVHEYRARLQQRGFPGLPGERELLRQFDMIGLQRHIKVLGIFARLWWRDGKIGYLADLPLTLAYCCDTAARYGELQPLARWLEHRIAPKLAAANAKARAPS